MFDLDISELTHIRTTLSKRLNVKTKPLTFTQMLTFSLFGLAMLTPARALSFTTKNSNLTAGSTNLDGLFVASSNLEDRVKEISVSNNAIAEFESRKDNDLATITLAYIKRCQSFDDSESCMRAGIRLYTTVKDQLVKQNKQLPGITMAELSTRAIWAFMVNAVNAVPNNPVYLVCTGLALIAENDEVQGYDLIYRAYRVNREVAGVVGKLVDGSTPQSFLHTYDLLSNMLDPNAENVYFTKDEVLKGEKQMLSKITEQISKKRSEVKIANNNTIIRSEL